VFAKCFISRHQRFRGICCPLLSPWLSWQHLLIQVNWFSSQDWQCEENTSALSMLYSVKASFGFIAWKLLNHCSEVAMYQGYWNLNCKTFTSSHVLCWKTKYQWGSNNIVVFNIQKLIRHVIFFKFNSFSLVHTSGQYNLKQDNRKRSTSFFKFYWRYCSEVWLQYFSSWRNLQLISSAWYTKTWLAMEYQNNYTTGNSFTLTLQVYFFISCTYVTCF
jgi:hypothetical protein